MGMLLQIKISDTIEIILWSLSYLCNTFTAFTVHISLPHTLFITLICGTQFGLSRNHEYLIIYIVQCQALKCNYYMVHRLEKLPAIIAHPIILQTFQISEFIIMDVS